MIDRVVARRGREHIFDNLDPAKTALVVVDMQNGFMVPELGHAACKMAHEIVPNINRLAQAVRDTGGAVIWIQTAYTDETLTSWSTSYEMVGPKGAARRKFSLSRENKGYEIFPDLKIEKTDLIVEKNRYSAFIQGSSNIEEVLNSRGLDTVLITGTVTNVCCESTARDAMMRNYKTVMITDGNAANTDEDHNAALNNFYLTFGDIMSTDFAIECLRAQCAEGPGRGGVGIAGLSTSFRGAPQARTRNPEATLLDARLWIPGSALRPPRNDARRDLLPPDIRRLDDRSPQRDLVLHHRRHLVGAWRWRPRCRAISYFCLGVRLVQQLGGVVVHLLDDLRRRLGRREQPVP